MFAFNIVVVNAVTNNLQIIMQYATSYSQLELFSVSGPLGPLHIVRRQQWETFTTAVTLVTKQPIHSVK